MTQIAWDGPHFGNPPTPPNVKAQETMSPLDEDNRGYKMMENMGYSSARVRVSVVLVGTGRRVYREMRLVAFPTHRYLQLDVRLS